MPWVDPIIAFSPSGVMAIDEIFSISLLFAPGLNSSSSELDWTLREVVLFLDDCSFGLKVTILSPVLRSQSEHILCSVDEIQ